ncbi:MAG: hypothetical protein F4X14_11220 [Caldilineaceae bacterium SB0661_bin_32]|uniref:Uncharacterized protein n=1 Tax=Caldilineaceae bacterium SB0661_bin_32 TaxID=2605255 RepID=A0A6B1D6F8_9CHLR|nr:hypothetical protein [Caldilineaceae bacterium SB0661_bin_32]
MTLTLNLSPELELRLLYAAERLGLPPTQFIMQFLDKHLPQNDNGAEIVSLLQSWIDEEDDTEQKETGDYLQRVLDEDRLSERKLFPSELKGVSW